jgi:hypothetical protein
MTLVKRFAAAALVAGCSLAIASPSYAFMTESAEVATPEGTVDITQVVDQLRQELKAGKTECDAMLSKIDAAIEQIDAALDKGVADEQAYLGLRDELVEMRLTLPCLAKELTSGEMGGDIISDSLISETVIGESEVGSPLGSSLAGSTGSTGGMGSLGGVGGGTGAGISPLALGGIAAAIAIPLALSDDDEPGNGASPSN